MMDFGNELRRKPLRLNPDSQLPLFCPSLNLDLWLEAIILKDKREIKRVLMKAHSPLRNWTKMIRALFTSGKETLIDLAGNSFTFDGTNPAKCWCNSGWCTAYVKIRVNAGVDDDSFGLLAGSGTNPVTFDDYDLAVKYPQGSGAGYLDYDSVTIPTLEEGTVTIDTTDYNYIKLIIQRPAYNDHTETQTVNEVGLAVAWERTEQTTYKFLVFRDLLDTPLDIPAGATAVLRYHLRWLVPV